MDKKAFPSKFPAADLVLQEVRRFGPMTFRTFMDIALYHPLYGYYNRREPQRGRSGDYFTSFQVSPLFSEIMADAILEMKRQLDSDHFTLIEFGSGGGEFLEGVLHALKRKNELKQISVVSVERSSSGRENIQKRISRFARCQVVSSMDELEFAGGFEGCVFSNEFFDALSFHRLKYYASGWKEIFIAEGNGKLIEQEGPLSDPSLVKNFDPTLEWVDGQEIEVRTGLHDWYGSLATEFFRGYVVTFDYGYPQWMLYSPRRMKGTWLCYHQHKTNQEPLERIGRQDITAHVDFTQLTQAGEFHGFEPQLFSSQAIFLSHRGEKLIESALKTATPETQRSITGAVQQLLHPDLMGESFWVLVQSKEVALPPSWLEMSNRLRRLKPVTPVNVGS